MGKKLWQGSQIGDRTALISALLISDIPCADAVGNDSIGGIRQLEAQKLSFLKMDISWLVVWNMAINFPYIGNNHPNWRTHIFQRGRSTTNQSGSTRSEMRKTWTENVAIAEDEVQRLEGHSLLLRRTEWVSPTAWSVYCTQKWLIGALEHGFYDFP